MFYEIKTLLDVSKQHIRLCFVKHSFVIIIVGIGVAFMENVTVCDKNEWTESPG